jgi:putative membrane protein
MRFLRYVGLLLRGLLFIALFLLALKNTDPVTLRFYFDQSWHVPLVFVMAGFFALGVVVTLVAFLAKWVALRREIGALKRVSERPPRPPLPDLPPGGDGI